jgi:molecular chaperone GrpE
LEHELEQARGRSVRLMADFQNYQRRAQSNEITARQLGEQSVAMSVVSVLDHFDMAMKHNPGASAEQLLEGLRVIHGELIKALGKHGVSQIVPQVGDEFTPGRHEALMQQPGDSIPAGHVISVLQAGYALGTGESLRVIRPAKVIVAS